MTSHTNSKYRESEPELSIESSNNRSCILLEDLASIIESIKTNLIDGDLYGPSIDTASESASCNEGLFDAVLPLYNIFFHKKNQDKFLEEFYGLFPDASKYLNCSDTSAASIIMIEIPNRLDGLYKIRQIREESKTKPTEIDDIKLDPSERRPLSYISGYIVSKLYVNSRNRKNEYGSELQALLQALKSTGQYNEFLLARSRGGLVSPILHLIAIVEEAEVCIRKKCQ